VENSIQKRMFTWPMLLAFHFLLAAAGSMLIGFFPEALVSGLYYNSGLEPYSPVIALVAFFIGYLLSFRVLGLRAAEWTGILGALWLLVGVHELTSHWNASWSPEKTRWEYALANLFGSTLKCSGSECLYEIVFTTPFTASVTYSIGAYLQRFHRNSEPMRTEVVRDGSPKSRAGDFE
jgi:hypothetical protein